MTDKEMLQAMSEMLQPILENIKEMKTDISELKTKVSNLEEGQKRLEEKIDRNYDKTEDFFVQQMEHNTEVSDKIDRFGARQEIFENQTIKNTAELRRIK